MYQVVYVTMHKVSQRQMLVWDQPYDGADGAASDVPVIISVCFMFHDNTVANFFFSSFLHQRVLL